MSIIGKRVKVEYPKNATEMGIMEGIVVDKFRNSMRSEASKTAPGKTLEVMIYDNYLIVDDNGDAHSVHPTLVVKVFMTEMKKV